MPWTLDLLVDLSAEKRLTLYRNAKKIVAKDPNNAEAQHIIEMIIDNDLLIDEGGGLSFDHPTMIEIQAICSENDAVAEAIGAAEQGLPPLAGMEHRLVAALGEKYGINHTTNYAGRCIADEMLAKGWIKGPQKPMPNHCIAKSATTFSRRVR